MARRKILVKADPAGGEVVGELVQSFVVNERINQLLIERLDPAVWHASLTLPGLKGETRGTRRAKAPGARTRTIAAIFAHMHNVRRKWIRLSAPHLNLPVALDRACTREQARKALAASGARCAEMIEQMLTSSAEKRPIFLRDGWARGWPAGPLMVAYMIAHEAHHRGQVCMLAHQLGFRLTGAVTSAMWRWEGLKGTF